jgi:hypothetical protein
MVTVAESYWVVPAQGTCAARLWCDLGLVAWYDLVRPDLIDLWPLSAQAIL